MASLFPALALLLSAAPLFAAGDAPQTQGGPQPQGVAGQFEAKMRTGVEALERRDFARAQADFQQATGLKPDEAGAWLLLAEACARQRNPQAALAAAEQAEKLGRNLPAIVRGLAHFYSEVQPDLPAALRQLRRAVELSPYDEQAHFQLAQACLVRQDFGGAIAAVQNARKIFDKSPQLELALGVAYYGARNFPAAVDQFLKTMALAPDLQQPYVFLGRILEHAGDRLPEAGERFAAYQARNPRSPLGYVLQAQVIVAGLPPGGYPPEAARAFELVEKAIGLGEDSAQAHYLMGLLLERKGEYAAAAAQLEKSIKLNARDPAPHYRLARVYLALGRKEEALEQRRLHEQLSEEETAPAGRGTRVKP